MFALQAAFARAREAYAAVVSLFAVHVLRGTFVYPVNGLCVYEAAAGADAYAGSTHGLFEFKSAATTDTNFPAARLPTYFQSIEGTAGSRLVAAG
jgi:hypothetical protein